MTGPRTARVGATVRRLTARFAEAGIDTPRLDAELLVAHALEKTRAQLFLSPDHPLTDAQARTVADLERRRADERESVAHLLGVRGFRYLDLRVDRRVLIPRPETELLVEVGLELPQGATVIDVGTGSGAIALALAHERPDLVVHATDVSTDALAVARANAERLGLDVSFHEGDLLAGLGRPAEGTGAVADETDEAGAGAVPRDAVRVQGAEAGGGPASGARPFLAILSNPPYIPESDRETLPPEVVRHDPDLALFGGADGLDVVRRLLPAARAVGADLIAIEVGEGQPPATVALAREHGFPRTTVLDDLAGIGRVVVGRPDEAVAGRDRPAAGGDDSAAADGGAA